VPEVSRFYGIIVRIFFNDHGAPHFHAEHGGRTIKIAIRGLSSIRGELPPPVLNLLLHRASLQQGELLAAWERAQRGESPGKIAPLD